MKDNYGTDDGPCTCSGCRPYTRPSLSRVEKTTLALGALLVAALAFIALGCDTGGSGPTTPVPTVEAPSAPVGNVGTPAATPSSPEAPPSDYVGITAFSEGKTTATVTVRNKDNGQSYRVHGCMYTPSGPEGRLVDQDETTVAPGGAASITVDLPRCGLTYQYDVALQGCSETPVFSPGYFLGYRTGTVAACTPPPPSCKPRPQNGEGLASAAELPWCGSCPVDTIEQKDGSCKPVCHDVVTWTGTFNVDSLSNTGDYAIYKGNTKDKDVHLVAGSNVGSFDYPPDGSTLKLVYPPERKVIGSAVATCGGGVFESWHGSVSYVCAAQHSCPQ